MNTNTKKTATVALAVVTLLASGSAAQAKVKGRFPKGALVTRGPGYHYFAQWPKTGKRRIDQKINRFILMERNDFLPAAKDIHKELKGEHGPFFQRITFKEMRPSKDVVSFVFSEHTYIGGENEHITTRTYTFDLKTGRQMQLSDLFYPEHGADESYLTVLGSVSQEALKQKLGDDFTNPDAAKPAHSSFKKWALNKDGVHLYFDQFEAEGYSGRTTEVVAPYEQVVYMMKDNVAMRVAPDYYEDINSCGD